MKRIVTMIASLGLASTTAVAGGMETPIQSGAGAAVSNAFVATANDASAVAYNPSGLAWQSSVAVTIGARVDYRDSSVKLPAGIAPNLGSEPNVGYAYIGWAPLDSNWAVGAGFAPLYQLNNDWTGFFPVSGSTKLIVDHAMADAVYAVNSNLAIGLGGDWYISRADFIQGAKNFKGNDYAGFGGHASMTWKPAQSWSLGAIYRSGSTVDITGGANDRLKFKLPDMVTVGVAHDFADVWHLEVDARWTRWSAMKSLNVLKLGVIDQANPLNLRDTFGIMAGLSWTWMPESKFHIGYAYDQGANKSAGFNPVMADQDGHNISLGASGDVFGFYLDVAYNYTYFSKKTATGTYAGTYRDRKQNFTISSSWHFD